MVRFLVLIALCSCDSLFQLDQVHARPIDATFHDAPIPGLVAYYPMDELGPQDACMVDMRGGPAGTCHGMPALVASPHDRGYQFDGSAYITVPTASAMPTAFTVTAWMRVRQPLTPSFECGANRVDGSDGGDTWQLCVFMGGVYFGGGDGSYTEPPGIEDGSWHMLAMTYDGTALQGYLDAKPEPAMPSQVSYDSQPLVIGVDIDSAGPSAQFFQQIDELAIYDRVLSEPELAALYRM